MYQTKTHQSLRASLLVGAATATVFAFGGSALAQGTVVETVVVTGSRIPSTQGLVSASPLQVVGSQEVQMTGTTNVEHLLNQLPQSFADFGENASNGASGTATINLRNLGNKRTLVLIDGKRLLPGDTLTIAPDLNFIPAALVERVEVVTGGASAVYGSDAIAGVVNFIMRKDFNGVEIDGTWSGAWHNNDQTCGNVDPTGSVFGTPAAPAGCARSLVDAFNTLNPTAFKTAPDEVWDGQKIDATIIIGTDSADGKGNVTMYAGYRNVQPILESQRDFSACGSFTNFDGTFTCLGSSNSAFGRFASRNAGSAFFNVPFKPEPVPGFNGDRAPYIGGTDAFNFAPFNYLQRPDTRWIGGAFAHYEVESWADFYLSGMFMDDHTLAQIAPSGLFRGSGLGPGGNYLVNCDNPFLGSGPGSFQEAFCNAGTGLGPTDSAFVDMGRRMVEGGPRIDDLRHTSYRFVLGVKGALSDHWSYDLSGSYGSAQRIERYQNDMSLSRIGRALQVVDVLGVPTCKSVLDNTDTRCVPLDIFNVGNLTPAMIAYIEGEGQQEGENIEQVLNLTVFGDLGDFKSPWATNNIGMAFGAEYRRESLVFNVDDVFASGDLAGQGGPTPSTRGAYDVVEAYVEVQIPIVEDMDGFQLLQVNAGYRTSNYSSAGDVQSWKYGVEWAPFDDIKGRASWQRAVRAPNVVELFFPQSIGLWGGQDPCAGAAPTLTAAQCLNTGVPLAAYGTVDVCVSGQCSGLFGGNPNLNPEISDTESFGIVFTPTFFDGFSLTADWFDIEVEKAIGIIPQVSVINQCALAGSFCGLIHRDPAANYALVGNSSFVDSFLVNTGAFKTSGIDVEASYRTSLADWGMGENGTLAFHFIGTWLDSFDLKNTPLPEADDPTYSCKGLFGVVCGTPIPTWRHSLRVTWATAWDWDFSVNWRYVGAVKLDANQSDPQLNGICGAPCGDLSDDKIDSFDYIDIAASWNISEGVQIRAGINNVFDKDPPFLDSNYLGVSSPPFGNGNTYPQVYDSLGRVVFVGATVKM